MRNKKDDSTKLAQSGGINRRGLRDWYRHRLGQHLLRAERQVLDDVLPNLFGYHLIQVGSPADEALCTSSLIPNRVLLESGLKAQTSAVPALRPLMLAHAHALPILTDSVDVVVLAHTLEFEQNPHQVLREADRVLVPEGHVVILGFNPWSPWGLWHLLVSRWAAPPWNGQFRSMWRIRDWLELLGFDVTIGRGFFFCPPLPYEGVMRRLSVLEKLGQRCWPFAGAVYIIVAKKRVMTMTPIRPRWRPGRSLVGAGMAKTSTQRVMDK
jgi:SAM-dependent methyltransferase